jgi:hypothetical protein
MGGFDPSAGLDPSALASSISGSPSGAMGGDSAAVSSGRNAQMTDRMLPRMPGARARAPKGPSSKPRSKNPGASMRGAIKRIGKPRRRTGIRLSGGGGRRPKF